MKKIVSFLLVLVLVFSSFSMVFAFDFNDNRSYWGYFSQRDYFGSSVRKLLTGQVADSYYTFEQFLDLYLIDCQSSIGYGSSVKPEDLQFVYSKTYGVYILYYAYEYNTPSTRNAGQLIWSILSQQSVVGSWVTFNRSFNLVKNSQGYSLCWDPSKSAFSLNTVTLSVLGEPIVASFSHLRYKVSGTNALLPHNADNGSQGVSKEYEFYVDYEEIQDAITTGINESEVVSILKKIYKQGETQKRSTIDSSGNVSTPDFSPSLSNDYSLSYNPSTQIYYTIDQSDHRQYNYTISNEYNYQYINYYMPGSDVPFQAAELYFELPDGRNSADLTYDEIKGMNVDFDCVNYTQVAVDPYQQALFHFDGNIDSDGVNNPLVGGVEHQSYDYSLNFSTNKTSYSFPVAEFDLPISVNLSGTLYYNNGGGWGCSCTYTFYAVNNGVRSVLSNFTVSPSSGSNTGGYSRSVSFTLPKGSSLYIEYTEYKEVSWVYCSWYASGSLSGTYHQEHWTTSNAIINTNPVNFEFTDNPIYTFVDTGSLYFDSALYLDGLSHDFKVNMATGSVISMFDYTYTFRWYQELSTDTQVNTIYIGGNSDNNSDSYLKFDGSKFTSLGNRGINKALNETIPVGSWNTISLVRSGTNILFFLNGNLIDSLNGSSIISSPYHDYISWHLAGNNLVRYLDELMFTDIALYTSNFVPRSQPYDSGVALVLPQGVNSNTLAIHSNIPVSKYQFGGVRSTMPVNGEVYVYIENNQIKSIQQWNGYMWLEFSGMVYFAGHWYSLQSFTIGTIGSQFDISDNPSGSGSIQQQEKEDINFLNLIYKLLSGVIDLIVKLFNSFVDLVERIFSAIGNLISKLLEGIGNFTFDLSPVESVSTGFWSVLPSWFKGFFTSAFTILIAIAVFAIFK